MVRDGKGSMVPPTESSLTKPEPGLSKSDTIKLNQPGSGMCSSGCVSPPLRRPERGGG
eukprot:m.223490 g.223490  ORF g.223490 m.223490 type:complete len:58 (-) comp25847_c0_seq8:806-979(-)